MCESILDYSWFQILRLTFHRNLSSADYSSFSNKFSDYLMTILYNTIKLEIIKVL